MPFTETLHGDIIDIAKKNSHKYSGFVQGCNCFGVMGSGLAGQIRNDPDLADMVAVDRSESQWKLGDPDRLGNHSIAKFIRPNGISYFYGVNAYTQYHHNASLYPVNYEAIGKVFMKLNGLFNNHLPLLVPKIGAGLAGGDWPTIQYIIDSVTPDIKLTLVEYTP